MTGPGPWLAALAEPHALFALGLTARTALVTLPLHLAAGLALGAWLARGRSPLKTAVEMAVTLPLVFPPVAIGFVLLMLLGRRGVVGAFLLEHAGVELVFSFHGVVLASFVAGLPLVVRPVQSAIRSLPPALAEAALVLGKTPLQAFFLAVLPAVRRSLAAGMILAFGRSLGEVGITMMLGGNILGRTNTLSLEIYNAVSAGEFESAAALCTLLGAVSACVFWALRRLGAF
ncbi:Sulfate transport system permease protein CysW [Fundidesulfovibrio magnetotacticus]|uniref:Sulfate transport system permease protein CysW n=1 Tax=Fundidesulfovibrio magnetotacticus TaxID=2730080 RepID=A0A6V8LX98_9BACT|nr:ABC transporter permease subunit [Fundidesulfovibrio magnetotacticus]GFK94699.1 Sulfate transport system permease protein CysW [Fundidesulfovibrio magnetotacticus]